MCSDELNPSMLATSYLGPLSLVIIFEVKKVKYWNKSLAITLASYCPLCRSKHIFLGRRCWILAKQFCPITLFDWSSRKYILVSSHINLVTLKTSSALVDFTKLVFPGWGIICLLVQSKIAHSMYISYWCLECFVEYLSLNDYECSQFLLDFVLFDYIWPEMLSCISRFVLFLEAIWQPFHLFFCAQLFYMGADILFYR